MTKSDSRIGGLNGKWAILFKVAIATYPVFVTIALPWCIWVTVQTFDNKAFRESKPLTQSEAKLLIGELDKALTEKIQTVGTQLAVMQASQDRIERVVEEVKTAP